MSGLKDFLNKLTKSKPDADKKEDVSKSDASGGGGGDDAAGASAPPDKLTIKERRMLEKYRRYQKYGGGPSDSDDSDPDDRNDDRMRHMMRMKMDPFFMDPSYSRSRRQRGHYDKYYKEGVPEWELPEMVEPDLKDDGGVDSTTDVGQLTTDAELYALKEKVAIVL